MNTNISPMVLPLSLFFFSILTGFACQIKGQASHKIISDAKYLLCNMTHRGAVGSDARDGDGAGVMTSIPHKFMKREFQYYCNVELPSYGQYAVGNLFFKKDNEVYEKSKTTFENIASSLGLRVLGWRKVPVDDTILGPAALSREPKIYQPAVVLEEAYGSGVSRWRSQMKILNPSIKNISRNNCIF